MGNWFSFLSSEEDKGLVELQTRIGYWFRNRNLLIEALTHDSLRCADINLPTYQRLEFLGDSVLNIITTEHLFRTNARCSVQRLNDERKTLIMNTFMREIAIELRLDAYVKVGNGFPRDKIRGYEDFVESLLGAIYADAGFGESGFTAAKQFVTKFWNL